MYILIVILLRFKWSLLNLVEGVGKEDINSLGFVFFGEIIYYDCFCKRGKILYNF